MIDFRKFNDEIRAEVRSLNKGDGWKAVWNWKVRSIGTNLIRLGWGYLDYLGEKRCFTIHADDLGLDDLVTCEDIDGRRIAFVDVGIDRWADTKSVDEAVKLAIRKVAEFANSRY